MREKLGLNRPLLTQYLIFMKGIFTLNLGDSLKYQRPIAELIKEHIGVTLLLTLVSTIFSLLISFPLGYYAGMHKDKPGDQIIRTTALAAIAMPSFWIGLLLMLLFGVKLRLLPVGGWGSTLPEQIKALILPGFTQSLMTSALLVRNIRNSVVDINILDYVDFARSKGISEKKVKNSHILRNAMISTVTLLAMRMAYMLGGSVIIETVFSLPGIGMMTVDAVFSRDYALIQALVFLFAFLVLIINLITDILYSFLDPRVEF
jgi:peptide/nickel transport system permease protein